MEPPNKLLANYTDSYSVHTTGALKTSMSEDDKWHSSKQKKFWRSVPLQFVNLEVILAPNRTVAPYHVCAFITKQLHTLGCPEHLLT